MPAYSHNPSRFTGIERTIADALVHLTEKNVFPLELHIPFPSASAAESAKARVWAYCRALERMADAKAILAAGLDITDQPTYLNTAKVMRNFTGRVVKDADPKGGARLHFIAQASKPEHTDALNYLTDLLMGASSDDNN